MRLFMNILVISRNYPYKQSNAYIFVKQLVDQFVVNDHNVTVVSPQSLTKLWFRNVLTRPYKAFQKVDNQSYSVYSPAYLSFSNLPLTRKLSNYLFNRAVIKTKNRLSEDFDIVYAHFINQPGVAAYKLYEKSLTPYFIALGESTFDFKIDKKILGAIANAKGFVAVSNEIKTRLLKIYSSIKDDRILIAPNGVNRTWFYKKDVKDLKNRLGIRNEDFTVVFVGAFINRKGPLRLNQALKNLNKSNIKAIFIGQGPENPDYQNIVFKGIVMHEQINDFLNTADVFVLPTLHEGSCNAIIEAMAAGLPIISSDKAFNDDILEETYSLRFDTSSVSLLQNAIMRLYNDRILLKTMSENAYEKAKEFDLSQRSKKILDYLSSKR